MQYTPNYNLNKPGFEDFADISVLNENMDKLDNVVHFTQGLSVTIGNNLNNHVLNMAQHNQFMDGAQKKQLIFGINRELNCLTIEEVDI